MAEITEWQQLRMQTNMITCKDNFNKSLIWSNYTSVIPKRPQDNSVRTIVKEYPSWPLSTTHLTVGVKLTSQTEYTHFSSHGESTKASCHQAIDYASALTEESLL